MPRRNKDISLVHICTDAPVEPVAKKKSIAPSTFHPFPSSMACAAAASAVLVTARNCSPPKEPPKIT